MASSAKKRKCYSTEEVLQFLQGLKEEDEDNTAALGDMEEDSDSVFKDSEVSGTESVGDLGEINAEIDYPDGQRHPEASAQARKCFSEPLVTASNGGSLNADTNDCQVVTVPDLSTSSEFAKAESDEDGDHAEDAEYESQAEVFAEGAAEDSEVDASLHQHSGRVWESSDTSEEAAESSVSDSFEEEGSTEESYEDDSQEVDSNDDEIMDRELTECEEEYARHGRKVEWGKRVQGRRGVERGRGVGCGRGVDVAEEWDVGGEQGL